MKYYCHDTFKGRFTPKLSSMQLLLVLLFSGHCLYAEEGDIAVIEIKLGDYRFTPQEIQLTENQPAVLRLVNTDSITPHNFTMKAQNGVTSIDVDILGGESVDVQLKPLPAGRYPFYCANRLLFMKSHREKGMEGSLTVNPE